jgi:hypothetical protein
MHMELKVELVLAQHAMAPMVEPDGVAAAVVAPVQLEMLQRLELAHNLEQEMAAVEFQIPLQAHL